MSSVLGFQQKNLGLPSVVAEKDLKLSIVVQAEMHALPTRLSMRYAL